MGRLEKKNSLAELIFKWILKIEVKMLSNPLDIKVWSLLEKSGLEMLMQESLGHRWYLNHETGHGHQDNEDDDPKREKN